MPLVWVGYEVWCIGMDGMRWWIGMDGNGLCGG